MDTQEMTSGETQAIRWGSIIQRLKIIKNSRIVRMASAVDF